MSKKKPGSSHPDWAYRPRVTYNRGEIPDWDKLIAFVKQQGGIKQVLVKLGISQESLPPPAPPQPRHYHKTETIFDEGDTKTVRVDSTRIKTVEELIEYHEIDTELYDVTPIESTYWESGAKLPDGTIVTIPLHRLKVRIAPKKQDAINITKLISDYLHTQPPLKRTVKDTRKPAAAHGVVAIGDLHIGANVKAILLTPEYNMQRLLEYLSGCAERINLHAFKEVSIFMLGDIIESFTGLNHKNSWQELELYGMDAVKASYKLITTWFLAQIKNLGNIYIVGGNHDRTTESMDVDVRGGVANMLAFMLSEKGYSATYHPLLIDATIDGLHYITMHGNFPISKQDAGQTLFKYGRQDMYNIILQAHKHTREGARGMAKKPVSYNEFKTVELDDLNYRKLTIAPMITGNYYSQSLGLNSNAGFTIIENSGTGKPIVHDYCF